MKNGALMISKSILTLGPGFPASWKLRGPSEAAVKEVAAKLGFKMDDALFGSVDQVYNLYYDVTSQDINYCPEIKFTDVPDWLETKRRLDPLDKPSII